MTPPNQSGDKPALGDDDQLVLPDTTRQEPVLTGDAALPHLVEQLEHPEWEVRNRAFRALVELDGELVVETLRKIAEDNDDLKQAPAIRALGRRKFNESRDILIGLFDTAPHIMYCTILGALEELGDPSTAPYIIPHLDEWLEDTGGYSTGNYAFAALCALGKPVIPLLIDTFCDEAQTAHIRAYVAGILGRLLADEAADHLLAALVADPDRYVRLFAAQALGRLGDKRAVEPMIQIFDQLDREYDQYFILQALEQIGTPEALKFLENWQGGEPPHA